VRQPDPTDPCGLAVRPRDPRRADRVMGGTSTLLWSGLLLGAPLAAGLAINAALGWWPGLAAFLIVALLLGRAAHRRRPPNR